MVGKLKRKPEQGNTSDGGRATKESKTYLLASHQAWAELESDMILGHADVVEAPGGEGAHVGASDSHSAAATRDASMDEQASGGSSLCQSQTAWVREGTVTVLATPPHARPLDLTTATMDLHRGKGGGGSG